MAASDVIDKPHLHGPPTGPVDAAGEQLTAQRLPESIVPASNLSPNEMRALKARTGRSLTELIGGDPNDMDLAPDRLQAMVWVALRRAGYAPSWEAAGDVIPDMTDLAGTPPDPTSTGS